MFPFVSETWPFSLDLLPPDAYLVGGSVRDGIVSQIENRRRSRQSPYLDLDFVLPERAVETAFAIAQSCGAGFVVLDEKRQIARVVFDQVTVDFAQRQGTCLEQDLRRRDFTINAIAYHPHQQILFDPLGGETDIFDQTIRMVSYENLIEDPLRLLRAYRQAAQLGFKLAPDTRTAIYQLSPHLQGVSIERIRSELDALLCARGDFGQDFGRDFGRDSGKDSGRETSASAWQLTLQSTLESLLQSQLLQFCLPHFTADSLVRLLAIDRALAHLQQAMPSYAASLFGWPKPVPAGFYRSWVKAAKLSCLVSCDPAIAQAELDRLKYSHHEAQVVVTLLQAQADIEAMRQGDLSRSQQFFLFKLAGKSFPAVSLLALAQGVDLAILQPMIARFLDPEDAIAHRRLLLTGTMLMKQLGIRPGPEIGAVLKAVEKAQAAGVIGSEAEAINWVKQNRR